jgi:DNA-binding MarR family transcriptional regulator
MIQRILGLEYMHMQVLGRSELADDNATPCYGASARQASRLLTRVYDEMLAPSGINLTQFSIAYLLIRHGSATISQLAGWMYTDKTAMGRNLLPMERDGLISIRAGKDRRSRDVSLTPSGRACYKKAIPLWRRAQKHVEELLGQQKAVDLRALLHQVAATH